MLVVRITQLGGFITRLPSSVTIGLLIPSVGANWDPAEACVNKGHHQGHHLVMVQMARELVRFRTGGSCC